MVAPGDQYQKLIAVMTKETLPVNDFQWIMCNSTVWDLIYIIPVCEEN
jgi:hypothetical protein